MEEIQSGFVGEKAIRFCKTIAAPFSSSPMLSVLVLLIYILTVASIKWIFASLIVVKKVCLENWFNALSPAHVEWLVGNAALMEKLASSGRNDRKK